ncbi:putative transcription factor B3-Domain family [Helianthus anomalus]
MLKRVKSMPVLTDGWQIVVSDLNLRKDCLLTFLPLSHFGLNLSCYVNDGSLWIVSTSKLHSSYVFSQGWPQVCNDLGIQEDDLLVFEKLDDVLFGLIVYRDEIEIRLSKKVESDDDDVFQISKADYFETLLKDIEEDDNIYIPDENPSFSKTSTSLPAGTVRSRTPKKVHVQEKLRKRDASHFKTMEDVSLPPLTYIYINLFMINAY